MEIQIKAIKYIDETEQEMKKEKEKKNMDPNLLNQTSLEDRVMLIGEIIKNLFTKLSFTNNRGYMIILEKFFNVYFSNPSITKTSECLNNFCTLGVHWDLIPINEKIFETKDLISEVLHDEKKKKDKEINKIISRNERRSRWDILSMPKENNKQPADQRKDMKKKLKFIIEKREQIIKEDRKHFPKDHGEHSMYNIPHFTIEKTEKINNDALVARDQRYKAQPAVFFKEDSDGLFHIDINKSNSHWRKNKHPTFYLIGKITNVYVLHDLDH